MSRIMVYSIYRGMVYEHRNAAIKKNSNAYEIWDQSGEDILAIYPIGTIERIVFCKNDEKPSTEEFVKKDYVKDYVLKYLSEQGTIMQGGHWNDRWRPQYYPIDG